MNDVKFEPVPNNENDKQKKIINATRLQVIGLTMALIHYIVCGIDSGYASIVDAHANVPGELEITKSDASWIASIIVVPMAPSCLLCGLMLTKMGKKTILLVISVLEAVSWYVIYRSSSVTMILIGRALSGIPYAMATSIMPQFLAEISRPNQRGLFLSVVPFGISTGLLIIHLLGAFVSWSTCALATAIILVIYVGFILYLPETYAWYFVNGEIERAERVFHLYRGDDANSREEFKKLLFKTQENVNCIYSRREMIRLCFSKLLLKPLLIAVVATFTLNLSGLKVLMFHSIQIVRGVVPTMNQYTSTIIVDVVRMFMTCIGAMLIGKYPVRILFMISGIGSAISHFAFAVFHHYSSSNPMFPILALMSLLSYIVFSQMGIVPLNWVITGEIFPLIVKGIGSGICTSIYFVTVFILVKIMPELIDILDLSGCIFWHLHFIVHSHYVLHITGN